MRIIAGTHRSRPIHSPPDAATTRPITDRVKEALFNRLWSMGRLEGGVALDIFCGTGSLGLEALSRGVDHVIFVERHRRIASLLERNLTELDIKDRATVLKIDAAAGNWTHLLPRTPVDLIFCDPPYAMTEETNKRPLITRLIAHLATIAADDAVLVLRTQARTAPEQIEGWQAPASHRYNMMTLHFYERAASPEA